MSHRPQPRDLELPRDVSAPRIAREWLSRCCGAELDEDRLATAQLLVTELVTNALVHGQGTITLRAQVDQAGLLAEVLDEGHGFRWAVPALDRERVGGWGLSIVASESDRWGSSETATRVWFELAAAGA